MKGFFKGIVLVILELLVGAASAIVIVFTVGIVVLCLWLLKLITIFILDYPEYIIITFIVFGFVYYKYKEWKSK